MMREPVVRYSAVAYGAINIRYAYVRKKRRSLEIAVHPDGGVFVKAPPRTSAEKIRARVKKRGGWILRQQRFFEQFEPRLSPRQYVGGESHLYLGKKYRLRIVPAAVDKVALNEGRFYVFCVRNDAAHIRRLLENWYRRQAAVWLPQIMAQCWRFYENSGYQKPLLRIQKMKTRWGSLSPNGRLTLNLNLIQAPKECIAYVITHELCHLTHPNHDNGFYRLLERRMANWRRIKYKLELTLARGETPLSSYAVL